MRLLLIMCICLIDSSVMAETWTATAYDACIKCCGKTDGITASGVKATPEHTIACNWLPFHTKLSIDGKTYEVEDRGARSYFGDKAHHIKRLDIYFNTHNEALKFGRQKVNVKIL